MYALLQEQGLDSTDLSTAATHALVQAVKAHLQAIKLYGQAVAAYIRLDSCVNAEQENRQASNKVLANSRKPVERRN